MTFTNGIITITIAPAHEPRTFSVVVTGGGEDNTYCLDAKAINALRRHYRTN